LIVARALKLPDADGVFLVSMALLVSGSTGGMCALALNALLPGRRS